MRHNDDRDAHNCRFDIFSDGYKKIFNYLGSLRVIRSHPIQPFYSSSLAFIPLSAQHSFRVSNRYTHFSVTFGSLLSIEFLFELSVHSVLSLAIALRIDKDLAISPDPHFVLSTFGDVCLSEADTSNFLVQSRLDYVTYTLLCPVSFQTDMLPLSFIFQQSLPVQVHQPHSLKPLCTYVWSKPNLHEESARSVQARRRDPAVNARHQRRANGTLHSWGFASGFTLKYTFRRKACSRDYNYSAVTQRVGRWHTYLGHLVLQLTAKLSSLDK